MSTWKKVIAQSNLIKHETARAFLIKIPKNKKGRAFWIPSRCVRFRGTNDYQMILSYTGDFEFRLDNGDTISVDEFESYFDTYESPTHRPSALNPDELTIEIVDSLLDEGE